MVKLDTPQLGEISLPTPGVESKVDNCCREDGSHANYASDELLVLADDGIQDGKAESGHGAGKGHITGWGGVLFQSLELAGTFPRHYRALKSNRVASQKEGRLHIILPLFSSTAVVVFIDYLPLAYALSHSTFHIFELNPQNAIGVSAVANAFHQCHLSDREWVVGRTTATSRDARAPSILASSTERLHSSNRSPRP